MKKLCVDIYYINARPPSSYVLNNFFMNLTQKRVGGRKMDSYFNNVCTSLFSAYCRLL